MKIRVPKNEQELLHAYAEAVVGWISEFGGQAEYMMAKEAVEKYAREHGLKSPDIDWSIYISEDNY